MFGRIPCASERSRSVDRQMSPATLTPTRANVTGNIRRRLHRRRSAVLQLYIYRGRRWTHSDGESYAIDADRGEDHLSWPQMNGLRRTGERHKTSDVDADRSARRNICRVPGRTLSDYKRNPIDVDRGEEDAAKFGVELLNILRSPRKPQFGH